MDGEIAVPAAPPSQPQTNGHHIETEEEQPKTTAITEAANEVIGKVSQALENAAELTTSAANAVADIFDAPAAATESAAEAVATTTEAPPAASTEPVPTQAAETSTSQQNTAAVVADSGEDSADTSAPEKTDDTAAVVAAKSEEKTTKSPTKSPKKVGSKKRESPQKPAAAAAESPRKKARVAATPPPEEQGDDEDDKDKKPLFEAELVVEGKRRRSTVERFVTTPSASAKSKPKEMFFGAGSGVKLGDIEFVQYKLSKAKPDELKPIHRLLFGRPGTAQEIRRNIRQFNGFAFDKDSDEYKKKLEAVKKWSKADLRGVADIINVKMSVTKEECAEHILAYLVCPDDINKKPPAAKKKAKSSTKSTKKSTGEKKTKKSKDTTDNADAKSDSDSGDESGSDDDAKSDSEAQKSDEDAAPSPKKPKATPAKSKPAAPTDAELKADIKALLKKVNLETTTMKQICQKIFDKHAKFDLTDKKDYIKATVKELINH